MIERHLKFLGAVFVVLLILVLFTESPAFKKGKLPKEVNITQELDEENIARIEIKRGDKRLEFQKINEIWTIIEDSVPRTANEERITRLIDNLSFLTGKVVGKSKSEFPSYDVDDKNGTFVTIYDKNNVKILELIIGKQGADFATNFVRLPNSNEVLLVEKSIKPQISSLSPAGWRNRRITNFRPEKVAKLEYEDENQRYMFYKENDRWILDSPEVNSDQNKIRRYIRMLGSVYSTGYIDTLDIKEYDAKKPLITVSVTLENGETQGFKVIEMFDENRYLVKREGDDFTLYTLAKNFVENSIKKERKWFIAEEKEKEGK